MATSLIGRNVVADYGGQLINGMVVCDGDKCGARDGYIHIIRDDGLKEDQCIKTNQPTWQVMRSSVMLSISTSTFTPGFVTPTSWTTLFITSNSPKKPKLMTRLNNMMKRLLDKDTQTLVKAGYVNGDLQITGNGHEALTTLMFEANKAELVKLAEEEIAERKAEKE